MVVLSSTIFCLPFSIDSVHCCRRTAAAAVIVAAVPLARLTLAQHCQACLHIFTKGKLRRCGTWTSKDHRCRCGFCRQAQSMLDVEQVLYTSKQASWQCNNKYKHTIGCAMTRSASTMVVPATHSQKVVATATQCTAVTYIYSEW